MRSRHQTDNNHGLDQDNPTTADLGFRAQIDPSSLSEKHLEHSVPRNGSREQGEDGELRLQSAAVLDKLEEQDGPEPCEAHPFTWLRLTASHTLIRHH